MQAMLKSTGTIISFALIIASAITALVDMFYSTVDLPLQAYVTIILAAVLYNAWRSRTALSDVDPQATPDVPSNTSARTAIDIQGGSLTLVQSKIKNHDVGIKSDGAKIKADNLEIS